MSEHELESALLLVQENLPRLAALHPRHELLKYSMFFTNEIPIVDGETASDEKDDALHNEFMDRFWSFPRPWREEHARSRVYTNVLGNYYLALKAAIQGEETGPQKPPPQSEEPPAEYKDEDIPF